MSSKKFGQQDLERAVSCRDRALHSTAVLKHFHMLCNLEISAVNVLFNSKLLSYVLMIT